jgi:transcriptional regulator with XRE-family HTH domain
MTIGQRLSAAMKKAGLAKPADLARASDSTTPTISNWLNDNVVPEHVKAEQLFRIARAVGLSGYELLTGEPEHVPLRVSEEQTPYASQSVQPEQWRVAFQLVAEALGEGLSLPPAKHAEVVLLTYELLTEGMPRAKVLRFVRTAAA